MEKCFTDPVHLDNDAWFTLSISKAGVGQTGALTQRTAFKLTNFLYRLVVLFSVFTHETQIITLLKTVIISCKEKTQNNE